MLLAGGQQPCPISDILPMTVNAVFLDIPHQVNTGPPASADGSHPSNPPKSTGEHHGNLDPLTLQEEVIVPADVQAIYDNAILEIADNKDPTQTLRSIWCKESSTGKLVDFVKENMNIALSLVNSEHILKITHKAVYEKDFIEFNRLSLDKPHIYAFLNRRAELDDDDVTAGEQYLLGFVRTDMALSDQTMLITAVTDFLINLFAAHQLVK